MRISPPTLCLALVGMFTVPSFSQEVDPPQSPETRVRVRLADDGRSTDMMSPDAFVHTFHAALANAKDARCTDCHDAASAHGSLFRPSPTALVVAAREGSQPATRVVTFDPRTGKVVENPYRVFVTNQIATDPRTGFVLSVERPNETAKPEQPKFWIGVATAELDDVIRAQLKIDEGVGLSVAQVVDDSPAKAAGLEVHDVIIRVGETPMTEFADLSNAVVAAGEAEETMSIEIVRKGRRRTIEVTPEERPKPKTETEEAVKRGLEFLREQRLGDVERAAVARWLELGPAIVVDSSRSMPKGVSIRIEKVGGEPARIHVERNGKFWDVTEKTLDELPEDLRGPVRSYLPGRVRTSLRTNPSASRWSDAARQWRALEEARPGGGAGNLAAQLKRIDERLTRLQEAVDALGNGSSTNGDADSEDGGGANE